MKKPLLTLRIILFVFFGLFLYLAVMDYSGGKVPFHDFDHAVPKYNGKEDYDPALSKLASMDDLVNYCDSIQAENYKADPSVKGEQNYPVLAASVIRNRFYHGYSSYGMNDNFMALLLEPLTGKWMSAIVVPDDIMKYPYAACSQQSIVMMELLNRKGYMTRKVAFVNDKRNGHFAFETFYNGGWHFFDTNLEPDMDLLVSKNTPSIAAITADRELLLSAYHHLPAKQVLTIFGKFIYGKPGEFPAPRGYIYQRTTKVLSYISWLIFLAAFLFVNKRYRREARRLHYVRNNGIYFPLFKRRRSPLYYPGYSASRA
jgi:hypothetical protein